MHKIDPLNVHRFQKVMSLPILLKFKQMISDKPIKLTVIACYSLQNGIS